MARVTRKKTNNQKNATASTRHKSRIQAYSTLQMKENKRKLYPGTLWPYSIGPHLAPMPTNQEMSKVTRYFSKRKNADPFSSAAPVLHTLTSRRAIRLLGEDILYRNPKYLDNVIKGLRSDDPTKQGVEVFILIAHGSVHVASTYLATRNVAVLHPSENEGVGLALYFKDMRAILNAMIGYNGENMSLFFNAMVGGYVSKKNDIDAVAPQISYTTPGHRMYNYYLKTEKDNKENFCGCWRVTNTLSTFNPDNFTTEPDDMMSEDPVSQRASLWKNPAGPYSTTYEREEDISTRLKSDDGLFAKELTDTLHEKYPKKRCFVFLLCCAGGEPGMPNSENQARPLIKSHFPIGLRPSRIIGRKRIVGLQSRHAQRFPPPVGRGPSEHPHPGASGFYEDTPGDLIVMRDIQAHVEKMRKSQPFTYINTINKSEPFIHVMLSSTDPTIVIVRHKDTNRVWFKFKLAEPKKGLTIIEENE